MRYPPDWLKNDPTLGVETAFPRNFAPYWGFSDPAVGFGV